ncbi:hypothetical protein LEP1GSC036_0147 [Leptospira weilii str. 2006001853]|uniref:Uncharacterized protein n=2 Tax=Leptospira weilii TaxID=28184 RepID=A0A828YXB1_9LEPT|nr:hypothetical protein LEP1GSC036_0147 [Leptospira weilii str. 2006001853]EMJ65076.1 hypothetical protein LEP1GSC051_3083 [Leptospira sp. P2653]EMN46028.1 hypothetical protein LEP1GSC086_2255 [Leptospira weilii str. LNT 1234]EMN91755.1 hypothetical protein LEP1GSC108_1764 [Leptospira weilii str. UI 13098]
MSKKFNSRYEQTPWIAISTKQKQMRINFSKTLIENFVLVCKISFDR